MRFNEAAAAGRRQQQSTENFLKIRLFLRFVNSQKIIKFDKKKKSGKIKNYEQNY